MTIQHEDKIDLDEVEELLYDCLEDTECPVLMDRLRGMLYKFAARKAQEPAKEASHVQA